MKGLLSSHPTVSYRLSEGKKEKGEMSFFDVCRDTTPLHTFSLVCLEILHCLSLLTPDQLELDRAAPLIQSVMEGYVGLTSAEQLEERIRSFLTRKQQATAVHLPRGLLPLPPFSSTPLPPIAGSTLGGRALVKKSTGEKDKPPPPSSPAPKSAIPRAG